MIPQLNEDVVALCVEATPEDTELRVLRGLKRRFPELSEELGLADTLATLRRARGRKVVIIIDQFEQWLNAHRAETEAELVKALRQCDGGQLQAIVMIRDDFAMAAARFMNALDVPIVQGDNFATVDLFDVNHAEKVLIRFGQAFGKLSAKSGNLSANEEQFVKEVSDGLAQDGKVVSVRLSLFAEMVKGKEWTPTTLKRVGGTQGIGINFLEETFGTPMANPRHRMHAAAARNVLNILLPEMGSDIKGHMRSHAELLYVSGYQGNPSDFYDLLRILDGELRLITPTECLYGEPGSAVESQAASSANGTSSSNQSIATSYFQLTHDYLVPSLREWLTRKQRETKRGRAELTLAERSSTWHSKRENQQLPNLREWLSILALTEKQRWTQREREMINRATKVHSQQFAVVVTCLLALLSIGVFVRGQILVRQEATRIEGLVGTLLRAEPGQIPKIIEELEDNQTVASGFLSPFVSLDAKTLDEKRSQLHARLAMVSRDKSLVEPLMEELLTNKVAYINPIHRQLRPYADELTDKLRAILRNEKADIDQRFRAATALANYVSKSAAASWTTQDLQFVAQQLVLANAEFQPMFRDNLRPISDQLLPYLENIFNEANCTNAQRLSAANAFSDYAANDISKLSKLLTTATPEQFAVLYPLVASSPSSATLDWLSTTNATLPSTELGTVERIAVGRRRANAAVTLLRLGQREAVLSVFDMTDDPESLTQFVFRCRDRGVRVEELLDCLRLIREAPVDRYPRYARYGLLLALSEYSLEEIPKSQHAALLRQLSDTYRSDPSAGVHGASGWLLRQWGQLETVREVDQTPSPYSADREWFTLAITVTPNAPSNPKDDLVQSEQVAAIEPPSKKTFFYTFIVFPSGQSEIGSFIDEPDREADEIRHSVSLTSPFALLDREITMEELIAFDPQYTDLLRKLHADPADAGFGVSWYDSVAFCRWLSQQADFPESDQSYASPELLDEKDFPRELTPDSNWAPRDWPIQLGRPSFRLPLDAEWEVAARSGTRTVFSFGSDSGLLKRFGWLTENSGDHVHPPHQLRPSHRGLYDMHGNQYEWTHDWYRGYKETSDVDPIFSEGGAKRVFRGGSWVFAAAKCRSSYRNAYEPTSRTYSFGFRIALSPAAKRFDSEDMPKQQ